MSKSLICVFFFFCISILISIYAASSEGFIGDANAQQCGVDKEPCPFGTACMNGWCIGTNPPSLPPTTGLPVYP